MISYHHHLGDYAKNTAHLSMLEDGAYRRLLDLYYLHEQPLPTDKRALYRLVRALSTAERKAVDIVLSEFFEPTPDGWKHGRCEEEIARYREKSDKARSSAARRWQGSTQSKRNANAHANADANASTVAMRTHSEGNANHQPLTINHKNKESLSSPPESRGAGESDHPEPGDYLPSATAYGLMAKLLRTHGIDVAPGRPDFREWVDKGLTDEEALAAIQSARLSKPAPEPIPWPYLAKVLTTQRQAAQAVPDKPAQPAKAAQPADRWWINEAGIDRKARELGMFARGGETYPAFKDRIFAELRKRGEATPQEQAA